MNVFFNMYCLVNDNTQITAPHINQKSLVRVAKTKITGLGPYVVAIRVVRQKPVDGDVSRHDFKCLYTERYTSINV